MPWILNDPPPKFGAELAECQRQQIEIVGKRYCYIGIGFAASSTKAYFFVSLPTTLRGVPTVSAKGLYAVRESVLGAFSNPVIESVSNNGVTISGTVSGSALSAGDIMFLQARDTDSSLLFNDNL